MSDAAGPAPAVLWTGQTAAVLARAQRTLQFWRCGMTARVPEVVGMAGAMTRSCSLLTLQDELFGLFTYRAV